MKAALAEARIGLRLRRKRTLLTALGIVLAAAMLAAAVTVSDSLGKGFSRAAQQAHLADIIVRFDPQPASKVAQRINALPDIRYFSLRQEFTDVLISAPNGRSAGNASVQIVNAGGSGPHGYALTAGHDVTDTPGQVVIERGLAAAWNIPLNGTIEISGLGPQKVVGFAEEPDNVSYPLAAPQIYISKDAVNGQRNPRVDEAQIWLKDPRYLNEVLVQARATSYGVKGLRFVTRSGVKILLDQAAGIVIDLLVALSVIALATASVLLASSARAEVERRLKAIGIRRALGGQKHFIALTQALEAALIAVPAATLGALAGALATTGPSDRLLMLLNEPSAGASLLPLIAAGWAVSIAIPTLAAAWPAYRAAGRPPTELLRGAELRTSRSSKRTSLKSASLTLLGTRLATARRARLIATAVTLGCSTAFVLLMLALASALGTLETDPQALGKRYQLTAALPATAAPHVKRIQGVQAVAPRYEEQAVDSYDLGETIDVVGFPGDATTFEAPPLTAGRRPNKPNEAEVGAGLADALGLSPGSELAIEMPSGKELRLKSRRRGRVLRPRRADRIRARQGDAQSGSRSTRAAGDRAQTGRKPASRAKRTRPGGNAHERRDRPRRSARRGAARDPDRNRGRGRPRVSVRARADVRADRAGAQTNGRGAAGVRRGSGRGGASACRRGRSADPACGGARDRARDPHPRPVALAAGRGLRGAAAIPHHRRHRGGPDRTRPRSGRSRHLGDAPRHRRQRRQRTGRDMSRRRITRREALSEAALATAATLLATGCSTTSQRTAAQSGSTLESTWIDPKGVGILTPGPGEAPIPRTELAPQSELQAELATLAHVTDAHVLDASSPARATFLDRLGPPFQSTFRPHETLTTQVLAGAVNAIRHLHPDAVIQGGDLIDNAQRNELAHALQTLIGGTVRPGSGPHGYFGVQMASDPDPFYYRPDLDAPRHPGLLQRATSAFKTAGVHATVHPVLGDHDILVQGELTPTAETRRLALGHEALWELPPHLHLPHGVHREITNSPDGPPNPGLVGGFLKQALAGPKQRVPADPNRREMDASEVVQRLANDGAHKHSTTRPTSAHSCA